MKEIKIGKLVKAYKALDTEAIIEAEKPLAAAIQEAEGRATARTVTAQQVAAALLRVEDHLHNIPQKAMAGSFVSLDINAQKFPSAYKYTPDSTIVTCKHNGKEWIATSVYRGVCKTHIADITLSDSAKEAVLEAARVIRI